MQKWEHLPLCKMLEQLLEQRLIQEANVVTINTIPNSKAEKQEYLKNEVSLLSFAATILGLILAPNVQGADDQGI